jgi:predicted Zn-dependent protease
MERPYQALASLEKALSLSPASPVMVYHLAKIYLQLGREKEALTKLETAIESQESFMGLADARQTLARLQASLQSDASSGSESNSELR